MAQITFQDNKINTIGELPKIGSTLPSLSLVNNSLVDIDLTDFQGSKKILNIFLSIDTEICAKSVIKFDDLTKDLVNVEVINISADLPFAQIRFCEHNKLKTSLFSCFRSTFSNDYGLKINDSNLKEICSRAVIIANEDNKIVYTEQVAEVTNEPNYKQALNFIKN